MKYTDKILEETIKFLKANITIEEWEKRIDEIFSEQVYKELKERE